jgi:hypothetical protein
VVAGAGLALGDGQRLAGPVGEAVHVHVRSVQAFSYRVVGCS